jgi:peptidoglycan-associated lipoprotein
MSKNMSKVMSSLKWIALVAVVLGLTACASKRRSASDDLVGGVGDSMQFYGEGISPEQERELLAKTTYYFPYDGFEVSHEDTMSVYAHAKRLVNSPRARIRVEGHTDERGSREYNIALGERRAKAVANILMLKGVGQNQISIVSYGREKPAVLSHDESGWAQNRRAIIVYEVE